jgi:hypothetical protein
MWYRTCSLSGMVLGNPQLPPPEPDPDREQGGLTEAQKRATFIRLVFHGDEERYEAFRRAIAEVVPPGTRAIVRGSAVTGFRWKDEAPFDSDGPGTSDVDLTLVGADVLGAFTLTGSYVPGVHTRPMGEEDPDIAPALADLRAHLTQLAGRPVNVQASRDWVIALRGELIGQPYLTLFGNAEPE